MVKFPAAALARIGANETDPAGKARWFAEQALVRLSQFRRVLVRFAPWMLPDFAELRRDDSISLPRQDLSLKELPDVLTRLAARLHLALESNPPTSQAAQRNSSERLLSLVSGAKMDSVRLIQDLQSLAAEAGMSMVQLAVAWVLENPVITAPIIGASRPEQLDDALAAVDKGLDPGLKARLDELTREYRWGDDIR